MASLCSNMVDKTSDPWTYKKDCKTLTCEMTRGFINTPGDLSKIHFRLERWVNSVYVLFSLQCTPGCFYNRVKTQQQATQHKNVLSKRKIEYYILKSVTVCELKQKQSRFQAREMTCLLVMTFKGSVREHAVLLHSDHCKSERKTTFRSNEKDIKFSHWEDIDSAVRDH